MLKKLLSGIVAAVILVLPIVVSAHVVVTPKIAAVGEEQLFSISVPNERQSSVTTIKLTIPTGVGEVMPTVKAGWTVQTTMTGDEITSIVWSDGEIPTGQRADFSFSAQVPAETTELHWKAYQTYADGMVVHWDQKPTGSDDSSGSAGPYSITKVSNDLTASTAEPQKSAMNMMGFIISLVALVLATYCILFRRR